MLLFGRQGGVVRRRAVGLFPARSRTGLRLTALHPAPRLLGMGPHNDTGGPVDKVDLLVRQARSRTRLWWYICVTMQGYIPISTGATVIYGAKLQSL